MNGRNPIEPITGSKSASCATETSDIAATTLIATSVYQDLADWLDKELERLEARFADFSTTQSLGLPKGRHSHVKAGS